MHETFSPNFLYHSLEILENSISEYSHIAYVVKFKGLKC